MKSLLLTICVLCTVSLLSAQDTPDFSYEALASLPDEGFLANQNIQLRVNILSEWSNRTSVYEEVHNTFTDEVGRFVIIIGQGSPTQGHIQAIAWNRGTYFLQLEISHDGGNSFRYLSTTQILHTPSARLTASSNQLWRTSNNRLTTESGLLLGSHRSFGSTYNTYPLTIVGEQALPRFPNRNRVLSIRDHSENVRWHFNLIDGNLTFTAAEVADGILMLERQGNVGIGTTSPRARLHIPRGDIYLGTPRNGVVMTSPDGQCWRMTVNNEGQPVFTSINCPQ